MNNDDRLTSATGHASVSDAPLTARDQAYRGLYEESYGRATPGAKLPGVRRRQRIETYCRMLGQGHERVLEIGCGLGDLTHALRAISRSVVGSDVSANALKVARERSPLWKNAHGKGSVAFAQMNATSIAFPGSSFDAVVSTSMIEHLYPDDVLPHLREVWRVLKPRGKYLVHCPNLLGHHGDRDVHFSMFSYRTLVAELRGVGFDTFRSVLFNRAAFGVDAKCMVYLESFLARWKIKILWGHLGVRNVLLVGTKCIGAVLALGLCGLSAGGLP